MSDEFWPTPGYTPDNQEHPNLLHKATSREGQEVGRWMTVAKHQDLYSLAIALAKRGCSKTTKDKRRLFHKVFDFEVKDEHETMNGDRGYRLIIDYNEAEDTVTVKLDTASPKPLLFSACKGGTQIDAYRDGAWVQPLIECGMEAQLLLEETQSQIRSTEKELQRRAFLPIQL